jgi:DNA-directed RNA polymerase sigma subunit (sigma70/sigma32)
VRKAMQELVAELTRPVALSDRAVRDLSHIKTARNEHLRRDGREPTSEQVSAATGFTPAHVDSLLATERAPRGIDERLSTDDRSGPTIGETLADPLAEQAFQKVLDDLEIQDVLELTSRLDARELTVIRSHYGLGVEARTFREIGAGLELTAERARQIEANALGKLRQALARPATVEGTTSYG